MFIFSLVSVHFFPLLDSHIFPLAFSYATMITKLFVISRNETLFSRPSIHPYSRPVIHPFCHHPPEKLGFMNSYIYIWIFCIFLDVHIGRTSLRHGTGWSIKHVHILWINTFYFLVVGYELCIGKCFDCHKYRIKSYRKVRIHIVIALQLMEKIH